MIPCDLFTQFPDINIINLSIRNNLSLMVLMAKLFSYFEINIDVYNDFENEYSLSGQYAQYSNIHTEVYLALVSDRAFCPKIVVSH